MLLVVLGFGEGLRASSPEIQAVSVRGLQVGATTSLVIDGDRLGPSPRLLLPFPATTTLKDGATDKKVAFDVTLDAGVTPGYHHLRLVTDGGVSLPVLIGVDALSQRPFGPSIEQLPVALSGTLSGSTVAETSFTGKAGEKVMIEVESQRLDGKLRPVLHLYGPRRVQLGWSWPMPRLHGDTRLEATLPADATYTITLHDQEYAGPAPGFYRLKVGRWNCIDQVFPPAVGKDGKTVELLGPAGPVRVELPPMNASPFAALPWPKDGTWSGPRPVAAVSPHAEVLEQPGSQPQDLPALPVGVSGRLSAPFEEDRYRIAVTPNTRIRLEVFAERAGSPLDAAVVIRNEMGSELVRAVDSPGTLDPVLEYAVPDKVTALVVAVLDLQGRGGPRGIYRLTVAAVGTAGNGDFRLSTPSQRVVSPVGGLAVVPVYLDRKGYAGRIDLAADGLPDGVKLEGTVIPPDADGTLVTVARANPGEARVGTWLGRAENGTARPVIVRGHPLEQLQPWLATELAVAATANKPADFAIDFRELAADLGLLPGGKLALPVRVIRPDPNTLVRLTLVTSQNPPVQANGQPNPNAAIRAERAVELGAKVSDSDVPVILPPDLPANAYQIAVQADILTPDRRTTLATVFTPVRTLPVKIPVALKLDGPTTISVTPDLKTGTTLELTGQVERKHGFAGDVALAVTGLPPGLRADPVTVKAGENKFTVKIVLPATVAPGELKGIKLNGTVSPDPKQPNQRVRSRDVELVLAVQPGKK